MKAVWVRAHPGNLGRVILRRVYDEQSGRGRFSVSLQPEPPAPHIVAAPSPRRPVETPASAATIVS